MNPVNEAKSLLKILKASSESEAPKLADDLLLFLYHLRDHYRIVKSHSSRFSGKSFTVLGDLIYNLEARPDETLQNEDWRIFIVSILEDIALERIVISGK